MPTRESLLTKEQPKLKSSDISVDQYFSKLEELHDRFAEQEEFASEINGSIVKWSAFVNSVSACADGICIQLKQTNEVGANVMHLLLPDECRTRALALRKGDRISFEGVLDTTRMVFAPNILAQAFEIGRLIPICNQFSINFPSKGLNHRL